MTITETTRTDLGRVGVCLPVTFTATPPADQQRAAGRRLEQAGYHTAWTNEGIGKDAFAQLAVLLAATDQLTVGTSIANIWARAPQTAHGAAAYLAQAYPGRFALGLGVGYPNQAESVGRRFGSPLSTMRDYITAMDGETWPPAPDVAYPRILAALGPKMLTLAAEITDGAFPAGQPVEHTADARKQLGPDKLLVVGLSIVADDDLDQARAAARQQVVNALDRGNARATLAEFGYTAEELADPSDRLVDALVAHGTPDMIATEVRAHLAAGADHVALLPPIGTEFTTGVDQLAHIAPALTDLLRLP
ncbi:TIGR03620 family F420-dependent LLM class oxidoreductase [Nocardia alni]|uniref:TIGR03620 family F420-dependent LLM class oxidoreductase n=1 Tax=Nocardia alni TaxID=2815723 RepID=UPI0020B45F85|nr:TIGR03620 family F420-dependent LLM class oxidoreductase [Nocardia alni]